LAEDVRLALTEGQQIVVQRNLKQDTSEARINWKSKTGGSDIGSGFHAIQAGLTAVKRRDPLAFFGSVAHSWNLSERQSGNDVDEGNTVGVRLGTLLATSPVTSCALPSMSAALDEMN
jgi:hypothetical protein